MPLHFEKKNTLRSVDFNNEKGTHIFNFGSKAALVAQSVERRSHNPKVASSILARRAHICHSSLWFFFPFFHESSCNSSLYLYLSIDEVGIDSKNV